MARIKLPKMTYVAWRDGRPRFVPGARERLLGFKGEDLRHADGRWYTLEEAQPWAIARRQEIAAARAAGKRSGTVPLAPIARGRTVDDLWEAYIRSEEFLGSEHHKGLRPASQASYKSFVKPLRREPFWPAPIAALDPVILKAVHKKLMRERGLPMARAALAALGAALAWGRLNDWLPRTNGRVVDSPYKDLKLPTPDPRLRVASDIEMNALVAAADLTKMDGVSLSAVGDAILLAFYSGQRVRDVVELVDGGIESGRVRLTQSKTGARVSIPMAPRLVERMAQARERRRRLLLKVEASTVIINERTGFAYTSQTLGNDFRRVRALAVAGVPDKLDPCKSLADFQFRDLRDTAVTWYARAGSTVPEIGSITGHAPASIYSILKHYLAMDEHLADNAVRKLIEYMEREGYAV